MVCFSIARLQIKPGLEDSTKAMEDQEWVDWFNNRRLLEPIGNIPPAEAEDAYHAALEDMPIAA